MYGGTPVRITADGAILTSGKPIRVYAASIASGAGGGAVVNFHNGTAASAAQMFTHTGTASKVILIPNIPACGLLFPAGCYVDVDTNTDAVVVWAEQVTSA